MYNVFRALLSIVWILDILDFPQVEFLDTTFPVNTLAWILIFIFVPEGNEVNCNNESK